MWSSNQGGDIGPGTDDRHPGFHGDVLGVTTCGTLDLVSTGCQVQSFLDSRKGELRGSIGAGSIGCRIDVDRREQCSVFESLDLTVPADSSRSLAS